MSVGKELLLAERRRVLWKMSPHSDGFLLVCVHLYRWRERERKREREGGGGGMK